MKNYKLILLALGVTLFSTSCVVDDEDEKLDAMSNTLYAVGFEQGNKSFAYFEDIGPVTAPIALSVFGGGDGSGVENDLTINYTVVDSSSAVNGVEYTLEGNSITVPAGAKFATLDLVINSGQLDPTSPTDLVIQLTSVSEGGTIVSDYSSVVITFVGCETDLEGTYTNPAVPLGETATFTPTVPPSYAVSALSDLTLGGATIPFTITDICGEITIVPETISGLGLTGGGTVNPDGSVTITYILSNADGSPAYGPFTSTYTPQ